VAAINYEPWRKAVDKKISDLVIIAEWAGKANMIVVRDSCTIAVKELRLEIERIERTEDWMRSRASAIGNEVVK